jgi:autotransporter-associated beta strand protein
MYVKSRAIPVVLCLGLLMLFGAASAEAALVGWNFDVHQNKFADFANDFHVWGTLEDSFKVPVFVSQVNFETTGPNGNPPFQPIPAPQGIKFNFFQQTITPNGGWPPYDFNATWKFPNKNAPFCTWMHFGLVFDASDNFEARLQGTWTRNGVDPQYNPIYGFEVPKSESEITLENYSEVGTAPLQMDLLILSPGEGTRFPLADLNSSFFDENPEWNQRFKHVDSSLLYWTLPSKGGGTGEKLTVPFSAVPGMRTLEHGEVLVARIKSQYEYTPPETGGSTAAQGDLQSEVFWEYIMHGAWVPQFVWSGQAQHDDRWTTAANWQWGTLPWSPAELQFGPLTAGGHASNLNDFTDGTQFNGITFLSGAPNYDLQGNRVVLGGPVTNLSDVDQLISLPLTLTPGGHTFDTPATGTLAVIGSINEEAFFGEHVPLVKTGSGLLILAGSNSYTGGTDVQDGQILVAYNDQALPTGMPVHIAAPGTVEIQGGLNVQIGSVTGEGILKVDGDASLTAPSITAGTLTIGGSRAAGATTVPEPSTLVLLTGALILLLYGRMRKTST